MAYVSSTFGQSRGLNFSLQTWIFRRVLLQNMSFARLALRSVTRSRPLLAVSTRQSLAFRANYSAEAGLSKETIQSRVLNVLKGFEKVDEAKVRVASSFNGKYSYRQCSY